MKKHHPLLIPLLLLVITFTASAQEKKFFTPADASYNNRSLYASRPNQLKWVGDQDILMKVDGKQIITMTPDGKHKATFMTLDEINGYANASGIDSLRRIPNITWLNDRQAYFYGMGKNGIALNCLDIKKKTIEQLTTLPQGAQNHPHRGGLYQTRFLLHGDLPGGHAQQKRRRTAGSGIPRRFFPHSSKIRL